MSDQVAADTLTSLTGSVDHPVYLVRHAPTSWTGVRWCGRADPPLSDAGRQVATGVAGRLAPSLDPGTSIWASPARRTRATAEAIALVCGLAIALDDDLLEVDVGVAEGLAWTELERRHPELAIRIAAGERIDWPGGETRQAVVERAARAAIRVRASALHGAVVVVSHGGLLHALAAQLIAPARNPGAEAHDPAAEAIAPIPLFEAGGILRIAPTRRG